MTRACIDGLEELRPRLGRYGKAVARARELGGYLAGLGDAGLSRRASKLARCGDWVEFRHYPTVRLTRLHAACFCQQPLLCQLCAIRRGTKLLRAYAPKIAAALKQEPGTRAYLVTVTVKNGEDLRERFTHLERSLAKLLERRKWALMGRGESAFRAVSGGVFSMEFKRGKGSGSWHPHAHGVVLSRLGVDQDALSAEWQEITGDSYVVDVRPITSVVDCEDPQRSEMQLLDSIGGDLCEVFKYAVKVNELAAPDHLAAYRVLARRRLIRSFGCLWGIDVPASLLDEPLVVEDLPYLAVMCRFSGVRYSMRAFFVDPRVINDYSKVKVSYEKDEAESATASAAS